MRRQTNRLSFFLLQSSFAFCFVSATGGHRLEVLSKQKRQQRGVVVRSCVDIVVFKTRTAGVFAAVIAVTLLAAGSSRTASFVHRVPL